MDPRRQQQSSRSHENLQPYYYSQTGEQYPTPPQHLTPQQTSTQPQDPTQQQFPIQQKYLAQQQYPIQQQFSVQGGHWVPQGNDDWQGVLQRQSPVQDGEHLSSSFASSSNDSCLSARASTRQNAGLSGGLARAPTRRGSTCSSSASGFSSNIDLRPLSTSPIQRPETTWKRRNSLTQYTNTTASVPIPAVTTTQDAEVQRPRSPRIPPLVQAGSSIHRPIPVRPVSLRTGSANTQAGPSEITVTSETRLSHNQRTFDRALYPVPRRSPYKSPYKWLPQQPRSSSLQPPPASTPRPQITASWHDQPCGCCPNGVPSELIRQGNAFRVIIPPMPTPIPGADSKIRWNPEGEGGFFDLEDIPVGWVGTDKELVLALKLIRAMKEC